MEGEERGQEIREEGYWKGRPVLPKRKGKSVWIGDLRGRGLEGVPVLPKPWLCL